MKVKGLMKIAYNHKDPNDYNLLYWISVPQHVGTHQGYIGVTGLTEVGLAMRYIVELEEVKRGERVQRTIHRHMINYQNTVTISIIGKNLTSSNAYLLESLLRPEDNTGDYYSCFNWNEVKGGRNRFV